MSKLEEKVLTADGDLDHFLFYMKTTGIDQTTFESVKYRGWFISTSQDEDQPVEMCEKETVTREIYFKVICKP